MTPVRMGLLPAPPINIASLSFANLRLACWERCSCAVAMRPVGRCVARTALSVFVDVLAARTSGAHTMIIDILISKIDDLIRIRRHADTDEPVTSPMMGTERALAGP